MIKKLSALFLTASLAATALLLPLNDVLHITFFKRGSMAANAMDIYDSINLDDDSEDVIVFKADISNAIITLSAKSFNYTGKQICPTVKVRRPKGIKDLVQGTQYTVKYYNNINPGTATVEVTGVGQFKGSARATFTIKTPLPPAVVTGLKTLGVSSNAVKLGWNKVGGVKGYVVYLKKDTDKVWTRAVKTTSNVDNYTLTKLTAGANYTFTIRAYITAGKEILSSTYVSTAKASTRPANVTGFKASTSSTTINLAWSKAAGSQGAVIYQAANGKWTRLAKVTGTAYKVTGLKPNTKRRYAIRAYRTVDGKELLSPSITTLDTSTGPALVNFTATAGSKKATLKWSKSTGATGYIAYIKSSANASWQRMTTTKATSFTKTGLVTGRTYYFTVKPYRTLNGKNYYGSFLTKSVKVK